LNQKVPLLEQGLGQDESMSFNTALQLALWSYRVTIHNTTGESPAFLVYGMDLRPPFSQDWRFAATEPDKIRINFLNRMREDIQFTAYQKRLHMNLSKNKKRIPMNIEENQLVLVRSTPNERQQAATYSSQAVKLVPKWSLPCRVLKVYPGGARLLVRNQLSGQIRDVHITDVRLIERPQDEQQRAIWEKALSHSLRSSNDEMPDTKRIREFWKEVEFPQAKKRQGV
jgi:hypothetical protein